MFRQLQPQDPVFVPFKLEEVSNPLARQWLEQLQKAAGPRIDSSDIDFYDVEKATEYRKRIAHRLRDGQFFARLSMGLDSLPDIRDSLPAHLRPLFNLVRPRDTRGLVEHMVRNLEWYLEPQGKPKFKLWVLWTAVISTSVMVTSVTMLFSNNQRAAWIMLLSLLFSSTSIWVSSYRALSGGEDQGSWKYSINAVELFRYLHQLHTATQAPDEPALMQELEAGEELQVGGSPTVEL